MWGVRKKYSDKFERKQIIKRFKYQGFNRIIVYQDYIEARNVIDSTTELPQVIWC